MADTASKALAGHGNLWAALCAAQAAFHAPERSKQGARGKYAPLESVMEAVRPILNQNGLVLMQPTHIDGETLIVETCITHVSTGECVRSHYPAGAVTAQHQALGGGLTYARRYSLLSLLGVQPEDEDNDGETAGRASAGARPQLNSSQAKKTGDWDRFAEKVRGFDDMNRLEEWWNRPATQGAIAAWPDKWQVQAVEEYEKAQERLADKLQDDLRREREAFA
jgi:hypothetical protein